ncbi:MAG: tRNA uridine-5-carboxymethylaminomethyl(34) synthesis GTPase MnmE [Bacteroidota bacterium]
MSSLSDDIVAAIATPIGEGGISVIRVSGKGACGVVDRIFKGRHTLGSAATHTAHFGTISGNDGKVIDQVIATVFHSPHSYTGEETVELGCHGGVYVTRQILNAVIDNGCRHAQPGEFTKRAFLNGRIDLVQAEAIADLIHAGSEAARKNSIEQLEGRLSRELRELREELIRITGLLELELDFVEEDIELTSKSEIGKFIGQEIQRIEKLVDSYKNGRIYRDGVKSVIVGRPNSGKSSLLNALLRHDRAIVSIVPGTTRDTIEENIMIDGILFRITDTAGLRQAIDYVEQEGIARAEKEIQKADIIILVADLTLTITEINESINDFIEKTAVIVALNKKDLLEEKEIEMILKKLKNQYQLPIIPVSAKMGLGIDELEKQMVSNIHLVSSEGSITLTNARHRDALVRGRESLKLALQSTESNLSDELIVIDLRAALNSIGEIIGETTTDDILNRIFSSFCIGK